MLYTEKNYFAHTKEGFSFKIHICTRVPTKVMIVKNQFQDM